MAFDMIEEIDAAVTDAQQAVMDLAVNLGIMESAITMPRYAPAQEGFLLRAQSIHDWARKQISEIHQFAEHYDNGEGHGPEGSTEEA